MITDHPKPNLREGMSLDDFLHQSPQQPFELINGKRLDKMPTGYLHGVVLRMIFRLLDAFVTQYGLGEVYQEMTFISEERPDWVRNSRVPDIMFYEKTRIEKYLATVLNKSLPLAIAPDLIIEILSPTDQILDIQDKTNLDLDNGVKMVWLIDPMNRGALVYSADAMRPQRFGEDGILTAEMLLPNFVLELNKVWA
jgi:Uma2 family endonuclease